MRDTDAMTITIIMICATLTVSLLISRSNNPTPPPTPPKSRITREYGFKALNPNNTASNRSKHAPVAFNPCFMNGLTQPSVGATPPFWYPNIALQNNADSGASQFCAQTNCYKGADYTPWATNLGTNGATNAKQQQWDNWRGGCGQGSVLCPWDNMHFKCDPSSHTTSCLDSFGSATWTLPYYTYSCGDSNIPYGGINPMCPTLPWLVPSGDGTANTQLLNPFLTQLTQPGQPNAISSYITESFHFIDCQVPTLYSDAYVNLTQPQMCNNYVVCLQACAQQKSINYVNFPELAVATCGPQCCKSIPSDPTRFGSATITGYNVEVNCQLYMVQGGSTEYNNIEHFDYSMPCIGTVYSSPTPLAPTMPPPTPPAFRDVVPPPVPTFQRIQSMVMHHWVPQAFRVGLP